jgi:oligopeptide transport system permease protein
MTDRDSTDSGARRSTDAGPRSDVDTKDAPPDPSSPDAETLLAGGESETEPGLEDELREEEQQLHLGAESGIQTAGTTANVAAAAGGDVPLHQATLWGDAWKQLRRKPLFVIAAILLIGFTAMALAPQLFTTDDPRNCQLTNSADPPVGGHPFGFDIQGCDYYTRVVYGTRVSLIIGLLVVGMDVVIAVILGAIAGFYGGLWDAVIARMADIWFALPTVLAGIVFLNVLGERGLLQVSFVLILLAWPTIMRLMRSSVLSGKEADYVQAARALGANDWRILRVHILPNGIAPVIVYSTISVGIIISAEAALSFLGVGLQLPAISWGLMISDAQNRILSAPHLLLFPAAFLSTLVLSFILLGDALRDALDPRLR